jgi:hypothetical protein
LEAFPWGSSVDEGGFPFSVETDEFEEEVQGGGGGTQSVWENFRWQQHQNLPNLSLGGEL